MKTIRAAILAAASNVALSTAVFAQEMPVAAQPGVEAIAATPTPEDTGEIIVTAQRRSESAQRVPISLTALPAESLVKANITSVQDIGRVAPSFNAFRSGQLANTRLSVRGIGSPGNSAIEPSVGAYVDGVYIARPGPLLAGLNDVASVEVLRGPQGTLFGRNASVGAVNIRTAEPTRDFEGSAFGEIGNYGRVRTIGMVNLPASDSLAFRVSALYDRFLGYGHNLDTGKRFGRNDTFSLRGSMKAEITPTLTWLLRGDYQKQDGDGVAVGTVDAATVTPTFAANFNQRLNGLVPRLDATYSYGVRQLTTGDLDDRQWGGASDLALDVGASTLRLISGYREWKNAQSEDDITFTPAALFGRSANYLSRSHSQELQFLTPAENRLSAVFGVYYFRERYDIDTDFNLAPGWCDIFVRNTAPARLAACRAGPQQQAATTQFHQITKSYAAFGQGTFKVTPDWDITGGLRYSHDDKTGTLLAVRANPSYTGTVPDNANDLAFSGGKLTYRINTTYRPARDIMLYATVSTGYKSGGFDTGTGSVLGNNRVFEPETVTNYEIGAKTQFANRKVTVNATLFRMDIEDFQLRSYNGTFYLVRNAGSIRQQGVEFDLAVRPARGLALTFSGTRLASEYTSFQNAPPRPGRSGPQDLTGYRVPYSPKWQGTGAIDYTGELGGGYNFNINGHVGFTSDVDVGIAGDGNPDGRQPGYALLGTRLSLAGPDNRWEAALSAENLTDKGYCVTKFGQVQAGALGLVSDGSSVLRCVLGEPRTIRGSIKVNF
ncbi:TonB-dependent receptor [Sphingomonas dokdonensis]|uniref:Pesticin receptor n=1 Tax=Sphingomonas dokdonensis TaxID=344880 RepID=A0A245ZTT2_9SPHN|nr:TonB-dependent receptor [Sphingomonas dokdonensis]OWK33152.1 pesticin receptor precursor [Sphingomonas dokdonensis]